MSLAESDAFFAEHGYYPTKVVQQQPRKSSGQVRAGSTSPAIGGGTLALKGWRAPLHWQVPPAFENPGAVYEALCHDLGPEDGHKAFCEIVRDYWAGIGNAKVRSAELAHDKWVVRALLRAFETARRGFRRQDVSGRKNIGNGGGGLFVSASGVEQSPEALVKHGRLVWDLEGNMSIYGAHNRELVREMFKAKLYVLYGVNVP
jgi:hypothetical protein